MKKFIIFLTIAVIHFGLSLLIMPITVSVAGALNAAQSGPSFGLQLLVAATRVLHFPIISLAWYSRYWFPGGWIWIPIAINSLLWAGGIYCAVVAGRKIFGKS